MLKSNILLDKLPDKVDIGGAEVDIDTDYRTAIRFTLLMQDRELDGETKLDIALYMFFGDAILTDLQAAVDAIMWFYRCGADDTGVGQRQHDSSGASRAYDFDVDAGLIYAAFWQQYHIDLQRADLHWWQFKALFAGLTEDTELIKILGYRTIRITDSMSKAEQKRYRELKRLYALPDNRTEEEKEHDFAASLAKL